MLQTTLVGHMSRDAPLGRSHSSGLGCFVLLAGIAAHLLSLCACGSRTGLESAAGTTQDGAPPADGMPPVEVDASPPRNAAVLFGGDDARSTLPGHLDVRW